MITMAIRACRGQRRAAYRVGISAVRASQLMVRIPERAATAPRGFGERAPVAKKNGAIQSRSPCEGEIGESNHGALVLEFLWFREPRFCCDAVADEISATWNFHLVRKGQFSRYKVDAEHSYASKNRVAKTVAPLFISSSQHSSN
ncbi:uncharacterized protein [Triticum aestivum]|uniref:uncharacterized protein n=1 Tax=Triticum aestivum TaxID=4565 RepID=UPI001D02D5E0|nr:uncharacterized protein LOC123105129 [Triticum aestivum]